MAKLVLGIGTSQSSILTIPPQHWAERGKRDMNSRRIFRADGTVMSYAELAAEVGDRLREATSEENAARVFASAQAALKRLAEDVAKAKPDLIVVIADDQRELFEANNMPSIAVYRGAEVATPRKDLPADAPAWVLQEWHGVHGIDPSRHYPGAPEFADDLIRRLIDREIDVAAAGEPASPAKGIGHAWAFVVNRLCGGRAIPMVPVILNTWFPPNVLTLPRCYRLGQALRAALEENPQDLRVAVITAAGMSHHLINESLDRRLLAAIQAGDEKTLTSLPEVALRGGTCQLRDWVVLAGAVKGLRSQWMDYWPAYRTPAGTGVGLAFASWS
jgi:hypothetical protein